MKRKHYFFVLPAGVIALVVVFAMLLSTSVAPIAHAAATVTLYTKASSVSVYSGSTFSLQVRLLKSTDDWVNYVDTQLSYNPAVLSIVGTSKSGSVFGSGGGPMIRYSNTTGTLSITGTSADFVPTPSDSLVATITFRAKTATQTSVGITSLSQAGRLVGQTNVKDYLMSTAGTSVTISAPPVVSAPVSPPASTVTTPTPTTNTSTTDTKTDDTEQEVAEETTSVNTEPSTTDEQVLVPVEQEQEQTDVAEEVVTEETSSFGWLDWLAGSAVVLVAVGGAAIIVRRRSAQQQYEARVLRNLFALGGTAQYAAEYIDPERLEQYVFDTSLQSTTEDAGAASVEMETPLVMAEAELVTVNQPHYDETEQLSVIKTPPTGAKTSRVHVPQRRKLRAHA